MKFDEIRLKFDEDEEVRALALYFRVPGLYMALVPGRIGSYPTKTVRPSPSSNSAEEDGKNTDATWLS